LMKLIDFLIIYLSCGAPFGVYYFLQKRDDARAGFLWLETALAFFFWIPFAFLLLRRNKNLKTYWHTSGKSSSAKSENVDFSYSAQKQVEKILLESDVRISIYELREIIDRYIGLTLAGQEVAAQTVRRESELYRVAHGKNIELASICFNRRNRKLLLFHQTEARKDFLRLIEKLSEFGLSRTELAFSSFKIVQILNDFEAVKSLENIFAIPLQTEERQSVKRLENDLWKPEEIIKPQPAKSAPIRLLSISRTTSLRSKG